MEETSALDIEEKAKEVAELIRSYSLQGRFFKEEELFIKPLGFTAEEAEELTRSLELMAEYRDIATLQGKKHKYYYSKQKMTDSYAQMVFRIEEKDLAKAMVELIRKNSRIYPRPTAIKTFYEKPFSFSRELIEELMKKLKENNEYKDIEEVKASNGASYLYSNSFLTNNHARSLAQWIEVDQYDTP